MSIELRIPSLLGNERLCGYRNMSNKIPDMTTLQRHAKNLFYVASKF